MSDPRHAKHAEREYSKLIFEQDKLEKLCRLLDNPNVERTLKVVARADPAVPDAPAAAAAAAGLSLIHI